ncbi:lipoprotein [Spongiibacter sp.]|uniref:LPS translocon maturation chaperone LptM n=1 Tax=Spongiibacter sp. TaxID=2024860 RepID=UPI0035659A1B
MVLQRRIPAFATCTAVALICLGLSACGQTGPLVLPEEAPATPAAEPASPATTRD